MKKIALAITTVIVLIPLAGVLFLRIRQVRAAAQADKKWETTQVEPLGDFGSTIRLEILPLYEEAGDENIYQIGHGVSYLIKTDTGKYLMDVGNNPTEADTLPLTQNMQALGVSWNQIDALVFSHFHPDHVGGVKAWRTGKVSFGTEDVDFRGMPVYAPSSFDFPGSLPAVTLDPTVLNQGVATIGSIEYGEVYPISLYVASGAEQALAVNVTGKGIVLITGCGHPTMERIVARAEALFEQPVIGIVGGLHYEGKSAKDVQPHIEFLRERNPHLVALSPHDSSLEALEAFRSAFPEAYREVQVGVPISLGE